MYLRFVKATKLTASDSREGFFRAAYDLRNDPMISPETSQQLEGLLDWFRKNLSIPTSFTSSKSKGYYRRDTFGISWFKPTAKQHIEKSFELIALLELNGYPIKILKTKRVGYVVYEDDTQIVAEPFADTKTK